MKRPLFLVAGCLAAFVACAPAQPAETPATAIVPAAPPPVEPAKVEPAPAPVPAETKDADKPAESLPSACASELPLRSASAGSKKAKKGEASKSAITACLPPPAFMKKLCAGAFPEVALGMFAKGTPWTRMWLAADVDAWNASGGFTHQAKVAFDEEVLVLSRHAAAGVGGIVMTDAQGSFDVLRYDGTCVSVMEGELTTRRPPAPGAAPIPWGRLEESTRRALLETPKVKKTHDGLEKACAAGAATTKKCEKADRAFSRAVGESLRAGSASLPAPDRRP